jgi:hypothetical protein
MSHRKIIFTGLFSYVRFIRQFLVLLCVLFYAVVSFDKEETLNSNSLFKKFAACAMVGTAAFTLVGCGGSSSSTTTPAPLVNNIIKGVAAKGPFKTGHVKAYRVKSDGNLDETNAYTGVVTDGIFQVHVGKDEGTFVVEAFGTYTDEATGGEVTIADGGGVKSIVALDSVNANKETTLMLTPLTHMVAESVLASVKASSVATTKIEIDRAIEDYGKIVKDGFGISEDIFSVKPNFASTSETEGSTTYAYVLAGFSKAIGSTSTSYIKFATSPSFKDALTGNFNSFKDTIITSMNELVESEAFINYLTSNIFKEKTWEEVSAKATKALTDTTSTFTPQKPIKPEQHRIILPLASSPSTSIMTHETASFTATIACSDGALAQNPIEYKWSFKRYETAPDPIPTTIVGFGVLSSSNFEHISAGSIAKTTSVSFGTNDTGYYAVGLEVSRSGYNTVTSVTGLEVVTPYWREDLIQAKAFINVTCHNGECSSNPTNSTSYPSATLNNWHLVKADGTGLSNAIDGDEEKLYDITWSLSLSSDARTLYTTATTGEGDTAVSTASCLQILQVYNDGLKVREKENCVAGGSIDASDPTTMARWYTFSAPASINATRSFTYGDFSGKTFSVTDYRDSSFNNSLTGSQSFEFSVASSGEGTGVIKEDSKEEYFVWEIIEEAGKLNKLKVTDATFANETYTAKEGDKYKREVILLNQVSDDYHNTLNVYVQNAFYGSKGAWGDFISFTEIIQQTPIQQTPQD